jgi:predicted GH43/DUF377 family glycosyl hydrolase
MFHWKKLGLIIKPNKNVWWMQTHCMIPTPEHVEGSLYKIYFSGRNDQNQSHIGFALIDMENPTQVLEYSKEPILKPGDLGCFDDNGVTPSCLVKNGKETHLYFIGWNPGSTIRMHIFGGLALSQDNGKTFERYSRAPIIERNRVNPFINTAPFVLKEDNRWIMYYVSGVEWVHRDLPRYNIQISLSQDGKNWVREGQVAIDFINDENALARPFVIKEDNKYKMFFASKGESNPNYRLKYAESADGLNWKRLDDQINFDVSTSGEDSEMIEYAAIVVHKGKKIMFYNGNNYGFGGILVAEEVK